MPNIVFRFPAGRYHATPWGNHVNEGLVEWPPSPWRLVRALLATGFSKLGWSEPPEAARELVEALASALPEYRLPRAVASHTRHWMPTGSKNPDKRDKVFDAFAHVGREAQLAAVWAVTLSPSAEALLAELVPKISYLGRAESVVEARLVADTDLPDGDLASPNGVNVAGVEPIALLAPTTASDYAAWLAEALPNSGPGLPGRTKKAKPGPFPPDSLAALLVSTAFLQEHGWTRPPGSRRVLYYRLALATSPLRVMSRARIALTADTALLALASDTRKREVLPRMERVLPQMETLHQGLLSQLGDVTCPELAGRGEGGVRLEGHRHALLIPLDVDGDGQIDHVLVHASMGFGLAAQGALRSIRRTFAKGGRSPLFVTLVGLGMLGDFASVGGRPLLELAQASTWTSRTPFVPPRHLKAKRHTLEDQVQAELASRGLPRATRIDVLGREEILKRKFHQFVCARREPGRAPPAPRFFGLRLELEQATRGPITLGYGSHFGLGLFTSEP